MGKREALGSGHDKTLLLQPQTPNICGGYLHMNMAFSILSRMWMGLLRYYHSFSVYWQLVSQWFPKEGDSFCALITCLWTSKQPPTHIYRSNLI